MCCFLVPGLAIFSEVRVQAKLKGFRFFLLFVILSFTGGSAGAQDWFRTAIGMDTNKPRIAIADFAPRGDSAKPHASLFTQVVRDDL